MTPPEDYDYILVCPACEAAAKDVFADKGEDYVIVCYEVPRCEFVGHTAREEAS